MPGGMFIGELSRKLDIPASTIRYYERFGLLQPPGRSQAAYRLYTEEDAARLRFIKQAKLFGFTLDEVKEIINLSAKGITPCEHVKGMIKKHIDDLERRIREMMAFREELAYRYEQLSKLGEIPGTICGMIEQACWSENQPELGLVLDKGKGA